MTLQEKTLYHQIHPAKLLTDWGTGLYALYPLWQHQLILALLIAFVPSIIASFVIIRYVDLERQKQSSFGGYISRYMTRLMQAIRFVGYAIMALGAWYHAVPVVVIGLAVILLAWLRGIILPAH
jgi:putative flippase GtrA